MNAAEGNSTAVPAAGYNLALGGTIATRQQRCISYQDSENQVNIVGNVLKTAPQSAQFMVPSNPSTQAVSQCFLSIPSPPAKRSPYSSPSRLHFQFQSICIALASCTFEVYLPL
ncbi:Uncharacterized protein HZ326_11149 [Fusarium oxysporum f. sp. albedinis]|nr:Uncharacterized protein HZ326_11149 [Fusarium oxysporum f. sp. albedinis]